MEDKKNWKRKEQGEEKMKRLEGKSRVRFSL